MSRWFAAPTFIVATIMPLLFWWWLGLPVAVTEPGVSRLPCVSYTPYRGTQTPLDKNLIIPAAQIESDLRFLAEHTRCVRTYSSLRGLDAVPEIAERLGLKVLLGAWLSRNRKVNALELATVIDLARRHPETIAAVIVGNEVLLRREMPPAELQSAIRHVRERVSVPVTYADVWEFWLKNPDLAQDVDFVTVHMLPYWEDEPTAIGDAVDHVVAKWRYVAQAFPGKPVMIGEAGWPSAGRMREGALPSRVNQARFMREMVAASIVNQISINLIEAFDQPWKRCCEGTVGGHWGVFFADRTQKFPLTGPVSEHPDWPQRAMTSILLAGVLMLVVVFSARQLPLIRWTALALACHAAAIVLVMAAMQIVQSSLTLVDWAVGIGRWGMAVAVLVLTFPVLARQTKAISADSDPASLAQLFQAVSARSLGQRSPWNLAVGALRALILFTASATTLCLIFDPRYRDFPLAVYAVPAFALFALACRTGCPAERTDHREEIALAIVLAVGGVAVVLGESVANLQALGWAGICALLALLTFRTVRACTRTAA